MHKFREPAKCKAWNDDVSTEKFINDNSIFKIRARNKDRSEEKNPKLLVSRVKEPGNIHTVAEHGEENSQIYETQSGASEGRTAVSSGSPFNGHRGLSCHFPRRSQRRADTRTRSYVRPSVYREADAFGAGLKQPGLSVALSRDESPGRSEAESQMLLQSDPRAIPQEQLVAEVKGIYAGLVIVEAKCIDLEETQPAAAQEMVPSARIDLRTDQWQSLIALHKQLLHEHHDFFLASQHPSASLALSGLAMKYSMPARMWRHGIHAFLEVLRHRLPESLEHMLAFIYIAYSMMALLYETVSTFEDTWIACLGDLGRYRMAVEDDEPKDREVWSNVALFWYNKAADKSPTIGRLYHHLAILARPYTLEQLSLYTRSLTCVTPFESAKGSIMTLFNPIFNGKESATRQSPSFETIFIKAHGILFTSNLLDFPGHSNATVYELEIDSLIRQYIVKSSVRLKETGVLATISNIAALFAYGGVYTSMKSDFPDPAGTAHRSLSEDFLIRGHLYAQSNFPESWFIDAMIDDNEGSLDLLLILQPRLETMLWLSRQFTHMDRSSRVKEYATWMSRGLERARFASRCIRQRKYFPRIREYVALVPKGLGRTGLFQGFCLVPFVASFLPAVSGSPIGNSDKADELSSIVSSVPLLAGSLYVGFSAAALAWAHSLAAKRGPIRVWGCMMGISAYGWWAVRNDVTASPSLSIADLGVWAISALQYGNVTFQVFRIPERVLLITLLGAAILDMAIVSFMTPKGAPISQSDLLSLSLPAMSLSLAITANLVGCFRNQPPSSPPSHEMEGGFRVDRVDPYYEGLFRQRPTIPSSGISRLRLLGNPLMEDSTRIWNNDD